MADVQEAVQQGQAEGRRLAGAGLGQAHQITPRHDMRNRLHLDGCRRGDGGFFQCFQYLRGKPEVCELGHDIFPAGGTRPPQWGSGRRMRRQKGRPEALAVAPLREGGNLANSSVLAPAWGGCSRGSGPWMRVTWGKGGRKSRI